MSVMHVLSGVESDGILPEPSLTRSPSATKLRPMRPRRLTLFTAILALVASCTSRDAASDGSRAGTSAGDSTWFASSVPWFDGTIPLLLVPAHSNDRALVVQADSLAPDLEEGAIEDPGSLLRLDGSATSVSVAFSSGSEGR